MRLELTGVGLLFKLANYSTTQGAISINGSRRCCMTFIHLPKDLRMKPMTRTQLFDRIHRASVWALLGLTGYGLSILGAYTYRYFSEVRPMQKELRQKQKEESILQEQMQREKELLQKQSEAETLSV